MADYTQITDFSVKDGLTTGDSEKIILGADFDAEFSALTTAISSKYDSGDIASELQAEALALNTVLITPLQLGNVMNDNAGMVADIQALADPNADTVLGWDDSAGAAISYSLGEGLASSTTSLVVDIAGTVEQTGLDGASDMLLMYDDSAGALKKVTLSAVSGVGGLGSVLDDATPQLGGDLDLNSFDITGTGTIGAVGNPGQVLVTQSGATADYGVTALGYATSNQLYFPRLISDAGAAGGYGFRISRTGTTAGLIEMGGTSFSMKDQTLNAAELLDYSVSMQAETSSAGVINTSYNAGQAVTMTLTENVSSFVINAPPGSDRYGEMIFKFVQGASAYTITWGGITVKWPSGAAPTMPTGAGEEMIVSIKTFDGGTTWYGDASLDYS